MSELHPKLGQILTTETERDACHIAIVPVVAGERLYPSQAIGLSDDGAATSSAKHIGIVDPFITHPINVGDKFYMWLQPYTITSLRHNWTHPDFDDETPAKKKPKKDVDSTVGASRRWLHEYADEHDVTYEDLMYIAASHATYQDGSNRWPEYICDGGKWEGHYTGTDFWKHYEIVTGTLVPKDNQGNFFTCAC